VDKNGQHIYREFFVPSPTTALVEANILTKLSALSQFQSSPAVYSYRWPRPTSGRLFQHYFAGFSRRNEDITAALKSSKENVAVVTDVKSYYPSIRRGPLLLNLKNRLKLSGAGARFSGHVESTVAAMLNQTAEVGIPIEGLCTRIRWLYMLWRVRANFAKRPCGSAPGREPERCGRRWRGEYRTLRAVCGAD